MSPAQTRLRLVICSVFAIAFGLITSVAHAQVPKKVINAQTITAYPPWSFKDPATNKVTGFDIDTLNAAAGKVGLEINWIETSFPQLISFAALKTGQSDMTGSGMVASPERQQTVNFVNYAYEPQYIYTLRDGEHPKTPEDVCGKRVAVTRSSVFMNDGVRIWSDEYCVKAGKPAAIIVTSDSGGQSQLMLNQGRVEAAILGGGGLTYQNSLEGNKYVILGKHAGIKPMYGWAFRKDDVQLTEIVKKGLTAIIADGTYDRLLRKWYMTEDFSIGKAMINGKP
ncbi:transporter substrate-binding domain-containing protein [Bradyrhizobium sp. B120]|uniref:transporter substrate-binding domain-containing protein n=1 Tax=Bradyrhizobium sp. B120 TaxID=3410088 RepID=UPI003B980A33